MNSQKVKKRFFLSFPRRRESREFRQFWTPAFAGETAFRTSYEAIKSISDQETISSRAVNHTTDLYHFGLQYVEDEIFVNHQYSISKSFQPFIFGNDTELWIRGQLCDGLIKLVKKTRGSLRAVFFDVLEDFDQVTLCRPQVPNREERAHFAFSLKRLIMA